MKCLNQSTSLLQLKYNALCFCAIAFCVLQDTSLAEASHGSVRASVGGDPSQWEITGGGSKLGAREGSTCTHQGTSVTSKGGQDFDSSNLTSSLAQ